MTPVAVRPLYQLRNELLHIWWSYADLIGYGVSPILCSAIVVTMVIYKLTYKAITATSPMD